MDIETHRKSSTALLTTEEAAAELNLEAKTLTWWRSQKRGPSFVRLGNGKRAPIRYRPAALVEYVKMMELQTGSFR